MTTAEQIDILTDLRTNPRDTLETRFEELRMFARSPENTEATIAALRIAIPRVLARSDLGNGDDLPCDNAMPSIITQITNLSAILEIPSYQHLKEEVCTPEFLSGVMCGWIYVPYHPKSIGSSEWMHRATEVILEKFGGDSAKQLKILQQPTPENFISASERSNHTYKPQSIYNIERYGFFYLLASEKHAFKGWAILFQSPRPETPYATYVKSLIKILNKDPRFKKTSWIKDDYALKSMISDFETMESAIKNAIINSVALGISAKKQNAALIDDSKIDIIITKLSEETGRNFANPAPLKNTIRALANTAKDADLNRNQETYQNLSFLDSCKLAIVKILNYLGIGQTSSESLANRWTAQIYAKHSIDRERSTSFVESIRAASLEIRNR